MFVVENYNRMWLVPEFEGTVFEKQMLLQSLKTNVWAVFAKTGSIISVRHRTVWRNEHFTLINAPTDKKTVFMMMSLFEQEPVRKTGPITTVKMGRTEFKQKSRNKSYRKIRQHCRLNKWHSVQNKLCWLLFASLKTGCTLKFKKSTDTASGSFWFLTQF